VEPRDEKSEGVESSCFNGPGIPPRVCSTDLLRRLLLQAIKKFPEPFSVNDQIIFSGFSSFSAIAGRRYPEDTAVTGVCEKVERTIRCLAHIADTLSHVAKVTLFLRDLTLLH
jgi:hypothetical protein